MWEQLQLKKLLCKMLPLQAVQMYECIQNLRPGGFKPSLIFNKLDRNRRQFHLSLNFYNVSCPLLQLQTGSFLLATVNHPTFCIHFQNNSQRSYLSSSQMLFQWLSTLVLFFFFFLGTSRTVICCFLWASNFLIRLTFRKHFRSVWLTVSPLQQCCDFIKIEYVAAEINGN